MSSNSTIATRAPAGGLSAAGSCTWVPGAGGANCPCAFAEVTSKSAATAGTTTPRVGILSKRRVKVRCMRVGRLPVTHCNGRALGKLFADHYQRAMEGGVLRPQILVFPARYGNLGQVHAAPESAIVILLPRSHPLPPHVVGNKRADHKRE